MRTPDEVEELFDSINPERRRLAYRYKSLGYSGWFCAGALLGLFVGRYIL